MTVKEFELNDLKDNIKEAGTSSIDVIRMSNLVQNEKSIEKDKSAENSTLDRLNGVVNDFLLDK